MESLIQGLDTEVAAWSSRSLAPSTKVCYRSHARAYLLFCKDIGCTAVPITVSNLCRYAAFLGREHCYSTVRQYLNVVRILHMENGHKDPLVDNFKLHCVLLGIKRTKGNVVSFKLPLSPQDLLDMHNRMNLQSVPDLQIWCAFVTAFFGVLRISAVSVTSVTRWDVENTVRRQDLRITPNGCSMELRHSKTNQFKEHRQTVVLPLIPDHPLCPTTSLVRFISVSGNVPGEYPLLTYQCAHEFMPLTQDVVRRRMQSLLASMGLESARYGTHSLRRGAATWLMVCGVPLHVIKTLGDWKSDCVFQYIKPDVLHKFKIINDVSLYLQ